MATGMLLDIRTALFAGAGFLGVVTALLVVFRVTRKTYPGFGRWTAASSLVALGFLLFGLRGIVPDFLSFVVGSTALAAASVARLSGSREFLGLAPMSRVWWTAPTLVAAGQLLLGFGPAAFAARVVLVSAAVSLPALATAACFLRAAPGAGALHRTTAGLLVALVGLVFARAATAPRLPPDLLVSSPGQTALLLSTAMLEAAWNVTFLMLNSSRLEAELRCALDDVKTLGRLLPICAWCKKIRDDGGYWQRVETFLGEHANARFTHGICPECEKKMMA